MTLTYQGADISVLVELLGEKLEAHYDNYQSSLIDLLMWHVIKPVCDRLRLNFVTGNGVWFFKAPGQGELGEDLYLSSKKDDPYRRYPELEDVFSILSIEDPVGRLPIGLYLCSYSMDTEL